MHQEHKANIGEVPAVNHQDRQHLAGASTASANLRVGLRRLECLRPRAFEVRYGAQPRYNRDFEMWSGPQSTTELATGIEL